MFEFRNFSIQFLSDILHPEIKEGFFDTLKRRVVISQAFEMGYNRTPDPERDV